MTRWVAILLAVALAGCTMLSDIAWRERRQAKHRDDQRKVEQVDMGVVLHVVRADPDGVEYIRGKPPLQILRSHRRGGTVAIDKNGARFVGRSPHPVQWYCSEDAEPLILHGDDLPDNLLVYGSEGAGKTTAQAMWCFFRVLDRIALGYRGEIGLTAPVAERLEFVKKAIRDYWSPTWYRWVERRSAFELHVGISVKLRATKRQSEATGSPIQGYNWSDAGSDEIQDSLDADSDIESRLRDAPNGKGKRFATATAKDSPEFRTWRDRQLTATVDGRPVWHKAEMLAARSPFMTAAFIAQKRATMTLREFERRYEAKDLGPERQVYYSWRRHIEDGDRRLPGNLRPLPIGAVDVTRRELSRWGPNVGVLVGHDPGKRQHVSEFLKAYEYPDERRRDAQGRPLPPLVRWFVVDEVTTPECTIESHVAKVLGRVREKWNCQKLAWDGGRAEGSASALVRIDPHTTTGEEHPDRTVYSQWRSAGFQTFAAAYGPTQKPTPIKVEARIDLVNTLLCNADNERRLFILSDDRGEPVAPKLVAAFEMMERNEAGKAEHENKDESDRSHWPAAVAYALWSIEKPRVDAMRSAA